MLLTILILFLIIFFLIIPVEVAFNLNNLEKPKSSIRVKLIFGLINFQLFPQTPKEKKQELTEEVDVGKKKRVTLRKFLRIVENENFVGKLSVFIKRTLKSIKFQLSKLYLRLGLDDPADTGKLWGIMGPVSGILDYYSDNKIKIEPEFQDFAFDIDGTGSITIIPLEIILISLIFLLSPVTVKTLWVNFGRAGE